MKAKDIVIFAVLLGIVAMIIKMMKSSKEQTKLIEAVALKTGAIKELPAAAKKKKQQEDEYEDDDEGGDDEEHSKPKKIKLKKLQKQIVDLFDDGIPKKIGEMKKIFTARHGKIEDDVKFNNTMYNLKPSNVLNFEKVENANIWGPGDWFDEDGSLYEEYIEKIEEPTSKLTIISQ